MFLFILLIPLEWNAEQTAICEWKHHHDHDDAVSFVGTDSAILNSHSLEFEILKPELTQINSPLVNLNQLEGNNDSAEINKDSLLNSYKSLDSQICPLENANQVMYSVMKDSTIMNSHKLLDSHVCPLYNPNQAICTYQVSTDFPYSTEKINFNAVMNSQNFLDSNQRVKNAIYQAVTMRQFIFKFYPAEKRLGLTGTKAKIVEGIQNTKRLTLLYFCLLMLQAGDMELNPGSQFPCLVCNKECDWSRYAVQCDHCDGWYHADCMNVNTIVYKALEDSNVSWICCNCRLPSFTSSLFSSRATLLSNSFSTLDSLSEIEDLLSPVAQSSPKSVNYNKKGNMQNGTKPDQNKKKQPKSNVKPRHFVKVMVINFQSVWGKAAELAVCLDNHQPDILIGTETWLSDSISNSEILPPNYTVIRKDRKDAFGADGYGGVFIALKNDLIATHRVDLDTDAEVVWAQIEIAGNKPVLVGAYYRPPSSKTEVLCQLEASLAKIDISKSSNIWLAGDFNLARVDWPNQVTLPNCPKPGLCRQMISIANDYGLEQVVDAPTRKDSILDLFFTNNNTLVDKVVVLPGMSDHDGIPLVTISTRPKINKSNPRKVFLYHRANYTKLREDMSSISEDFQSKDLDSISVNELWNEFCERVNNSMDANIPSKTVSSRNTAPWINHKIKKSLRHKQKAYNQARKLDDTSSWEKFRSLRKRVKKETRQSYRKYIKDVCSESNKKFWSFIKGLKKDSFGIPSLKNESGILEMENKQKAALLNRQFESVFTDEDHQTMPQIDKPNFPPHA